MKLLYLTICSNGEFSSSQSSTANLVIFSQILALTLTHSSVVYQKYAIEALVHSASKKDRVSAVINQATPILKELYQSQNDSIKVRALVVSSFRCPGVGFTKDLKMMSPTNNLLLFVFPNCDMRLIFIKFYLVACSFWSFHVPHELYGCNYMYFAM